MNISQDCQNKSANFTKFVDLYGDYVGVYDAFTIKSGLSRIIIPIWLILGIPGSIFCIILWTRPRMLHTSSVYLAALGVSDLAFWIFQVLWFLKTSWRIDLLKVPVICEFFAIIFYFLQYLSPLFTFGFTLERFILICFPFKGERCLSFSRSIKATVAITITAFCFSVIQGYFFEYQKETGTCVERQSVVEAKNWQNKLLFYWNLIMESLIFGIIPIGILLLNIFVIKETKVLRSKTPAKFKPVKQRDINNGKIIAQNKNASTTVMLLCVSFYFILSTLPVTIIQLLIIHNFLDGDECLEVSEVHSDPTWQSHFAIINAKSIVEALAMSHYAAKFYIYIITGKQFRIEFLRLFRKQTKKKIPSRRNGLETRNTLLDNYQSLSEDIHNI